MTRMNSACVTQTPAASATTTTRPRRNRFGGESEPGIVTRCLAGRGPSARDELRSRLRLPPESSREQEQAVAADLDLVEVPQALGDVRGQAPAVHARPVPASDIDDGADRAFHLDLAVDAADLLFLDGDVAFVAAPDDRLGADQAIDRGGIVPFDHDQDERVGRAE